jgi:recombination protein RecT
MTIEASKNGQLVKAQTAAVATANAAPPTLAQLVVKMKDQIGLVLPKHITADRMTRIATSALRTTRDLDKCTASSFLSCLMGCSLLGLEPNTPLGQAYLIPYKNKREGTVDCTLIIGYQGYLDLVRRSGQVASIQAFAVYAGDKFEYELGLDPKLKHVPSESPEREDPTKLTHAYCVIKLKDQGADPIFLVMPRSQIEKRKNRGAAKFSPNTPWATDYEAMALKTVVRAAIKWAPRSAEMATAVEVEDRTERGSNIINALPSEVQQHLLTSGTVTEADYDDSQEQPEPSAEDDGRA